MKRPTKREKLLRELVQYRTVKGKVIGLLPKLGYLFLLERKITVDVKYFPQCQDLLSLWIIEAKKRLL